MYKLLFLIKALLTNFGVLHKFRSKYSFYLFSVMRIVFLLVGIYDLSIVNQKPVQIKQR